MDFLPGKTIASSTKESETESLTVPNPMNESFFRVAAMSTFPNAFVVLTIILASANGR